MVFTPNFLRPQVMTEAWRRNLSKAHQMVETFLRNAEDDRLWIGRKRTHMHHEGADAGVGGVDSASESEEAASVASLEPRTVELAEGLPLEANELADAGAAADGGTGAS